MIHKTKIGVCVDEGIAYLLEEKNDEKVITIIDADEEIASNRDDEFEDTVVMSPYMRRKQSFYHRIFESIKNFDTISLFGTPSAKRELLLRIRANNLNEVEIVNNPLEEKITENHKIEFINRYFSSCSRDTEAANS
ncbi:MAG: hypothetical protein IR153_10915 [Flavobacterium sp.]|nr:hypothetical protein [Flavobacterium sp.]